MDLVLIGSCLLITGLPLILLMVVLSASDLDLKCYEQSSESEKEREPPRPPIGSSSDADEKPKEKPKEKTLEEEEITQDMQPTVSSTPCPGSSPSVSVSHSDPSMEILLEDEAHSSPFLLRMSEESTGQLDGKLDVMDREEQDKDIEGNMFVSMMGGESRQKKKVEDIVLLPNTGRFDHLDEFIKKTYEHVRPEEVDVSFLFRGVQTSRTHERRELAEMMKKRPSTRFDRSDPAAQMTSQIVDASARTTYFRHKNARLSRHETSLSRVENSSLSPFLVRSSRREKDADVLDGHSIYFRDDEEGRHQKRIDVSKRMREFERRIKKHHEESESQKKRISLQRRHEKSSREATKTYWNTFSPISPHTGR